MFEHFSFRVPRYGEDAVRKNPLNQKVKFICTPGFEEIFNNLFKGVDFDKLARESTEEAFKPRLVRVQIPDEEVEETEKEDEKPFHWNTEDYDGDEDEEPVKEPPSIFDMLNSGKEFGDIVSTQPKHTEIYRQAFGLDENGDPIPLLDDEEDDEVKDMSVFIANHLTFLIQTMQPVIFDTSSIETDGNCMTIALNEEKTFPKIKNLDELGFITCEVNSSPTIKNEIRKFLEGTEYSNIYCFPEIMKNRHGKDVWAFRFIFFKRK